MYTIDKVDVPVIEFANQYQYSHPTQRSRRTWCLRIITSSVPWNVTFARKSTRMKKISEKTLMSFSPPKKRHFTTGELSSCQGDGRRS